ncbi:MAG: hypothetical protein OEZ36_03705 [Spirochaetota bacterium]|nr:hypothetical protein [Spirochaetota bacterium]
MKKRMDTTDRFFRVVGVFFPSFSRLFPVWDGDETDENPWNKD